MRAKILFVFSILIFSASISMLLAEDASSMLGKATKISVEVMMRSICSAEFAEFVEERVDSSGKFEGHKFLSVNSDADWKRLGIAETKPSRVKYTVQASGADNDAQFKIQATTELGNAKYETLGHLVAGVPKCESMTESLK